jgi:site-specific DNA recombinase
MAIPVMVESVRLATPHCKHHRTTEMRLAHQERECCLLWYRAGGVRKPIARGDRRIDELEAEVVRRIFRDYAVGKSPRRIAFELNADGVPCPSGGGWGPSTINGNSARGTGILNNELYVGRLVWNRLRYAKNPDTGKRVSRLNLPEQWVTHEVPHCRIVSDELWQAVKSRQALVGRNTRPDNDQRRSFWAAQRPKTLLSGLTRCGLCGGAYTKISATQLGCATARNKGTCSNRQNIRLDRLEAQILNGLKKQLLDPELYKAFAQAFYAELNRLRINEGTHIAAAEQELAQIARKLRQLVDAIGDGGHARTLMVEVHRLEARQTELETLLAAHDAPPTPLIHPALPEVYRQKVAALGASLADPVLKDEAAEIIRSLVETIILTPAGDTLAVELRGELASILSLCAVSKQHKAPPDFSGEAMQVKLVAGTGFEPVTFRL